MTDLRLNMTKTFSTGLCIGLVLFTGCHTVFQTNKLDYTIQRINNEIKSNYRLASLIKPYADSVHANMNTIIAEAEIGLGKKQPESTLGNLMVDILLRAATEKYQMPVDASILNYGSIRLTVLAQGAITRGKVFELMPFDNIIVLQKLNGRLLHQLMDHIAGKGGWPVSGISMQIKNKLASNILINKSPLEESKTYTIALLDYVANGGDDAAMLRGIPQLNNGCLFREAILHYMVQQQQLGNKISAQIQNRITNAE